MSMISIITIALRICQGRTVTIPAMSAADFGQLLDAVAVLRKELAV